MKLDYKNLLVGVVFCVPFFATAQVGVNTTNPQAQLDITASNSATPSSTDGLLIPRVDTFPATNPTASQQGMLVYLTTTVGINTPGFYYWDNGTTSWKPISVASTTNDWSITGNSGTVNGTNFIGTTDNIPLTFRVNNLRSGLISNSSSSSTFFGYQAGGNGTAIGNSAFGHQALNGLTSGNFNTANGFQASYSTTTGISNTAYGYSTLKKNVSGNQNTAVGYQALLNNTGNTNTAIGSTAMFSNTTGNNNTSLGFSAMYSNISGGQNVAIGTESLMNNTLGGNNVAIGYRALQFNTTTFNNNAVGSSSLQNNTGGLNNAFGTNALFSNITGSNNVALGHLAGYLNTGNRNVFLGSNAGYNETGSDKLYIDNSNTSSPLIYGDFLTDVLRINGTLNINSAYNLPTTAGTANQVLQTNGTGTATWVDASTLSITETDPQVSSVTNNIVPKWNGTTLTDGIITDDGTNIGVGTTTPTDKVHVVGNMKIDGGKIPFVNTGGSVFIGNNAGLTDDLTNNQNVFVGSSSGKNNATGIQNLFAGVFSGELNTTGNLNVALGAYALNKNTTGSENIAVGKNALLSATTADGNVSIGSNAGARITTGINNIIMGYGAFFNNTTGNNNIVIGEQALNLNFTGENNVALGNKAGYNSGGSRNVFLGYNAGYNEAGNDKLYIDNSFTSTPLIYGDFATNLLRINGTLNINNTYSLPTTAGTANQILQTNGSGVTSWVNPSSLSINETDPQVSSTTNNAVPKWNGTTLTDGIISDDGVNVGVGTAAPASRFHVTSNNTATNTTIESGNLQYPTALSILPSSHATSKRSAIKLDDWQVLQDYTGTGTKDFSIYQGATNQQRLTINTAGNIGIGFSAPSEKLDVNGKTKTNNLQVVTGATSGHILQSDAVGNASWVNPSSLSITETDPQVSSATNNTVPKWNGTTLTDGIITDNGTNIGIGTVTPTSKLEVVGNTSTTNFQMTNGATNGYVLQSDASGNATWVNPSSLSLTETDPQVSSAINNKIPKWNGTTLTDGIITDNGTNIGIGTTSPTDKVHIVGNLKIDGGKLPFVNTGQSIFIGESAGLNDDLTTNQNVFVGWESGKLNTTGNLNTFVGHGSGWVNTTGGANSAFGQFAFGSNTTGYNNSAFGRASLSRNTTGFFNTANGFSSLENITTGNSNVGLGYSSLGTNITGSYNTALGSGAGFSNTGSGNVFIGYFAGYNEVGSDKLYIDNSNTANPLIYGDFATNLLRVNGTLNINNTYSLPTTAGTANQILQTNGAGVTSWVNPSTLSITETDPQVSSTINNTVPKWNGTTLTDGIITDNGTNIGIGTTSPSDKVHIVGNLKIDGGKIPFVNTGNSVFIGQNAGSNDDLSDNRNIYIGTQSGNASTTAPNNVAIGYQTLLVNNADNNTTVGYRSLSSNTTGYQNSAFGANALLFNTTGFYNTAFGPESLYSNTTGIRNTSVGFGSLFYNIIGENNTTLGYQAGYSNTGSNNVFLGYQAGYNETTSNKLYIDNSSTATPLIWGDFANDYVNINGNLGVGTTNPTQARLVVNGNESNTLANYGYLNRTTPTGVLNPGVTANYSIYASHRIAASEFNAFSDARIKKVLSRSNNKQDLETLAKIQITNYKHIDTIANPNKVIKKVIAQELKQVYPNAVSTHIDFIPNIYKQAEMNNGFIAITSDVKAGDKIKVITQKGEEIVEVAFVSEKGMQTNSKSQGKVFVYGKQVSDFHTVDYEALSTLNISATQELLKRIEQLEKENASLKTEVSSIIEIKNQLNTEKQELITLKSEILMIKSLMTNKSEAKLIEVAQKN